MNSDPGRAEALSHDTLLGGRVRIAQPVKGYRAGIDPVLLAAATPALAGERILDLGAGTGAAALCLLARVPECVVTGVEIEHAIARIARDNAHDNGVSARFKVIEGDAAGFTAGSGGEHLFDHVMMNPPYHESERHQGAADPMKARANAAPEGDLARFIASGIRLARRGGMLTLIQKADRLGEILAALKGRTGRIIVLPVAAREGTAAMRVIVQAVKGRRTPLKLLPPLVMHQSDGGYRHAAEAILRLGHALDLAGMAEGSLPGGG